MLYDLWKLAGDTERDRMTQKWSEKVAEELQNYTRRVIEVNFIPSIICLLFVAREDWRNNKSIQKS